jgi:hypothetical protein
MELMAQQDPQIINNNIEDATNLQHLPSKTNNKERKENHTKLRV